MSVGFLECMLYNVAEYQFKTWKDGVPNTVETIVTNDGRRKDINTLPLHIERFSRQADEGIYRQIFS